MHIPEFLKHDKNKHKAVPEGEGQAVHEDKHHTHPTDATVPKGFANDPTSTTHQPSKLNEFDDPTARYLGPKHTSVDPTNTGA